MVSVGTRLRELRKRSRMPVHELAQKTGIPPSKLYDIERGFGSPAEVHIVEVFLRAIGQEDEAPKILLQTARDRGSITLDLSTTTSPEVLALSIDLARCFRQGMTPETARKLRGALKQAS